MYKPLASVALAALATVPISAIKTEFMDDAFRSIWGGSDRFDSRFQEDISKAMTKIPTNDMFKDIHKSRKFSTKHTSPYDALFTPYSNSFVNNAVPGNTGAIEKAFDCCLEHGELIAALRVRLAALKVKAEENK